MKIQTIIAAAILATAAGTANAGTELFLDVNTLTATFTDTLGGHAFGTGATGTITLAHNTNSTLAGIRIDGVNQGPLTSSLSTFSGTITLLAGVVTGGSMTETNADGSSWTTSLVFGSGSVVTQAGQGFSIDALTTGNAFTVTGLSDFDGVNIGPWYYNQPLPGSVLTFAFNPNGAGTDITSDVDAVITVPMPMAAGLGLAGLAGIVARRRR